ncbi:MAG TPA: glycosyltransferase family 39 protein [Candidatus Saccharimonadales bacterium]|jgi:4-amino-4-deoxy-L-arabinose transferase-like glycosyltransferase|nr:glycosyltransferase family 39 protein [Candidatus Saccharimonadales bacterium]
MHNRRNFLFAIVAVWAVVYFASIFTPPLLDDADTVHAEAAREMVTGHDWVTLHIDLGFRYLEKAPLMYWAVASSFKLFGVHDWSARLPIALGVLALLLIVYRLGRRIYGEEGGFYAALALATGFGPFIFTRILIPDMAVGLWMALGFDFFLTTLEQEKPSLWLSWGMAATMALNVLTKGLIGLVFPLGAIFVFLLLTRNLRHLFKLHLISSFLVFLGIAAPWHLLAGLRNPAHGPIIMAPGPLTHDQGFFWFYFVNEHFLRFLNKRFPADYDTVPLWLFWGLMLLWLVPWTVFTPQALLQIPRKAADWRAGLNRQQQATLLFALWAVIVLVFFSFSSRQEYYVIPGAPGVALLIGGWLAYETNSTIQGPPWRWWKIASQVLTAIMGLSTGVLWSWLVLLLSNFSNRPKYYMTGGFAGLAAALLGGWLASKTISPADHPERRWGKISSLALMVLVGLPACYAAVMLAMHAQTPLSGYDIAELLKKNPEAYKLSFGHFLDLTPKALGAFKLPLLLTGLALAVGTVLNFILRRDDRAFPANVALALMMVVVLYQAHTGLVIFSPVLSSKVLADKIAPLWKPGDILEANGDYEAASTLTYYMGQQMRMLNGRDSNIWYGSIFPDAPAIFDDDKSFEQLWRGEKRVFFWTEEDKIPAYVSQAGYCQVAKWGGKLVLTNDRNLCGAR